MHNMISKKALTHIGTVELISLPGSGIDNVPAKVDTGADGSSIWASNIKLKNGELIFNLFAPGSAYYRTRPIITSAFKSTSVKNSFGHKELRYKVRLKVKIGKHTVTQWFSLADRSRNTYPVLLGTNILKRRFVVDVSERYLVSSGVSSHKVLVMDVEPIEKTDQFFKEVAHKNKLPLTYSAASYDSILYCLDGVKTKVLNLADNKTDLGYYTLTYFKSHEGNTEFAAAISEYLQFKGRPFIDIEVSSFISDTKLTEATKLACYGLPLPKTICAKTSILIDRYAEISRQLGKPFVLKEIASDHGKNNYLISSKKEFMEVLDNAQKSHSFIAQKFIPNQGLYRVYVFGAEAKIVLRQTGRRNKAGVQSHLSKPFKQADVELVDINGFPKTVQEIAVRAAKSLNRQVAGVDMVQDKESKEWYVLEVNSAPMLRSGSYVDEKAKAIASFFDKVLNR